MRQKKNIPTTTPKTEYTPLIFQSPSSEKPKTSSQASAYAPPSLENEKPKFDPIAHTKTEIAKNQKDLSDITIAFEDNKKTLADLEAQYNDPQVALETKNLLAQQYNKTLEATKQTENSYKEAFDRSAKLEVRRKALLAPAEARKELATDAMDGFINAVKRGYSQGEVVDIISKGGQPTKEDLAAIAASNKAQQALPSSKPYKDFSDAKTVSGMFEELAKNPVEILGQLTAESMATMYRHAIKKVPGAVAEGAAVGMVAGAASGAAAGDGIGALLGGAAGLGAGASAGFVAGMTLSGMNMEVAGSIIESFKDAGVDVTNAYSLQEAFKNKELMDDAKAHAYKRAVPIALFDMVSMGIAGKVLGKGAKTVAGKVAKGGIEVGEQMALAGAGETSAQLIADGEFKPTEVMAEMLGEVGGGAPEIAVGTMVELKKQGKSIFDLSAKMDLPKEQFDEMVDVSEGSGDITSEQSDEIKAEYAATQKAKSSIPVEYQGSVPLIDMVAQKQRLEEDLQKHNELSIGLDASFQGVTEEKRLEIQTKIDELNKNIQEQLKVEQETIQAEPVVEPTQEIVQEEEITPDLIGDKEEITPEAAFEDVKQTKSSAVRLEKTIKFVDTHFDSIVSQAMLNNKIKRKC